MIINSWSKALQSSDTQVKNTAALLTLVSICTALTHPVPEPRS